MTNDTKRLLAIVLFGVALIGSLTPSYLHVAAFMAPVMPAGLPEARFVAALALDVLVIASSYAIIVTPPGSPRGWAHLGLWSAVGASVYANARYALGHTLYGPDVVVSAMLPVLAVIATHALAAVLRAVPADGASVPTPAPVASEAVQLAPAKRRASRSAVTPQPVAGGVLAQDAAVAPLIGPDGVSPRTARDLRSKGDPRYADARARLNVGMAVNGSGGQG